MSIMIMIYRISFKYGFVYGFFNEFIFKLNCIVFNLKLKIYG